MRYLHPVQAHEQFVASGCYRFAKDGIALAKREFFTIHQLGDSGQFVRVDHDARQDDGKSILLEAFRNGSEKLLRFDLRYENTRFEGGIRYLNASYQLSDNVIQVGYQLNGAERLYVEKEVPAHTTMDIPVLILRGNVIALLARNEETPTPVFVPTYEHVQLFPGVARLVDSAVRCVGEESVMIGRRKINARRFRYMDNAASYWIDEQGVIVKRISAFKQQEFSVQISEYAHRS